MRRYAAVAVVLLIGVLVVLAMVGRRITLIADGPVELVALNNQGTSPGVLSPGTRAIVVACEDRKSDIVPKIRLADGREAYVGRGQYHLLREPIWVFTSGPILIQCP
jgi:hypothetical protein